MDTSWTVLKRKPVIYRRNVLKREAVINRRPQPLGPLWIHTKTLATAASPLTLLNRQREPGTPRLDSSSPLSNRLPPELEIRILFHLLDDEFQACGMEPEFAQAIDDSDPIHLEDSARMACQRATWHYCATATTCKNVCRDWGVEVIKIIDMHVDMYSYEEKNMPKSTLDAFRMLSKYGVSLVPSEKDHYHKAQLMRLKGSMTTPLLENSYYDPVKLLEEERFKLQRSAIVQGLVKQIRRGDDKYDHKNEPRAMNTTLVLDRTRHWREAEWDSFMREMSSIVEAL